MLPPSPIMRLPSIGLRLHSLFFRVHFNERSYSLPFDGAGLYGGVMFVLSNNRINLLP